MMGEDRTSLDMNFDDFDDFEPKSPSNKRISTKKKIDKISSFPSREATEESQINMKGNSQIINRFKILCKEDRRSYVEMLGILMDDFKP